jgi:hypothetical protein
LSEDRKKSWGFDQAWVVLDPSIHLSPALLSQWLVGALLWRSIPRGGTFMQIHAQELLLLVVVAIGIAIGIIIVRCSYRGRNMNIKVVSLPKANIAGIPDLELAFYVHVGHLRNELMTIEKFLVWTLNNPPGEILSDLNVSQDLVIIRLLAGKLWEGWQLLQVSYFATKVSQSIASKLSRETSQALTELKNYFSRTNDIDMIRNEFAFHYSPDRIREQLAKVEDTDQLSIYLAEKNVNCFYQFAEAIADSAMLEAVHQGDFDAAIKKLSTRVMNVTLTFIEFCDGCLNYMMETYLLAGQDPVNIRKVKLSGLLRKDQITLPFFVG